jgi:predicted O-methyltransferase YrrM
MSDLRVIYDDLVNKYGTEKDTVHTFSDKGTDHTYIEFYQERFNHLKSNIKMLEIGIMTGGSLLLWSKFFDNYKLVGIELSPSWSYNAEFQQQLIDDENIDLHFNISSTNEEYAAQFEDEAYDVILDDGDHDPNTQIATFMTYISKLKTGGTYYIEDVRGEQEFRQIVESIQVWKMENKVELDMNAYMGNLARRPDDVIITITKL